MVLSQLRNPVEHRRALRVGTNWDKVYLERHLPAGDPLTLSILSPILSI